MPFPLPPPLGFEPVKVLTSGPYFHVLLVTRDARRLVVKRPTPRFSGDSSGAKLVENEARALERLAGTVAPRLIAKGHDAHGPFVVTEWIDGTPLGDLVYDAPKFRERARAAFGALARIHERGVAHGDPSPSNVLFDSGSSILLDFGLARFDGAEAVTTPGTFVGTLAYAAPEVARDGFRAVSFASDVFALAASLLHHSSGRGPRPELPAAALLVHAVEVPIDAHGLDALLPGLGDAVLERAGDRPTARALADD